MTTEESTADFYARWFGWHNYPAGIYDVNTTIPASGTGLTYTEFSADPFEDLDEYFKGLEWKKANTQYLKSIFNGYLGLVKIQEEREKIFRKRDVSEIKKSLHELLRTTYSSFTTLNREYQGEWIINEQDS